jgi:mRNA-degrading endonuclease RelE of RelBE toxin-antitoxin system
MPSRDRDRLNSVLNEMMDQPLTGDIVPLRGEYQGAFRRRVGAWRIIFTVRPEARVLVVHDILRRSSTTY